MAYDRTLLLRCVVLPQMKWVGNVTEMVKVEQSPVQLVAVSDEVLARLIDAAANGAAADEVTAPVTPGTEWTSARLDWLRRFHRDRREGLAGPLAEATWAIVVGDEVEGSVRLKQIGEVSNVEIGIWLTRQARGRGIGKEAVRLLLDRAASEGAVVVSADTRASNAAALALLSRCGFSTSPSPDGVKVHARRCGAQHA